MFNVFFQNNNDTIYYLKWSVWSSLPFSPKWPSFMNNQEKAKIVIPLWGILNQRCAMSICWHRAVIELFSTGFGKFSKYKSSFGRDFFVNLSPVWLFTRDLENIFSRTLEHFLDHLTNPGRAVQAKYYRSKIFSTAHIYSI